MNNENRRSKAIVPEQSRELILPSEMIHRGFELAVRIEEKQGIQTIESSDMTRSHKGLLVGGAISFMEWYKDSKGTYKLKEPDKREYLPAVFLWVSFDPDGLHFSCASRDEMPAVDHVEGNDDRYRLLNELHDTNPFTVPLSSFGLYYKIVQPHRSDMYLEMSPNGPPGYIGPATRKANPYFNVGVDCLKIVLVYISLISDSGEKREIVHKDPPVNFSFIAVDSNGENDPASTYDLYHTMLEAKNERSR